MMDIIKTILFILTVYQRESIMAHSMKCYNCKTESSKISKAGFYRHEMTAVDISDTRMVVGIRGTVRQWFNLYRWYSYNQFGVVTIYDYVKQSWQKSFELSWIRDLSAVAISNQYMALISKNGSQSNAMTSLSIFKYTNNSWTNHSVFTLRDNMSYYSLEIQDDTLAVGASNYRSTFTYIYQLTTSGIWSLTHTIYNISGCYKHSSVAMHGDFLIIGCPSYHVNSGIIYIFEKPINENRELGSKPTMVWDEFDHLSPKDRKWYSYFGNDVAIFKDMLAVGRYGDNTKGYCAGAVIIYKFVNNKWMELKKLIASDGSPYDYFGWSVSIGDGYLVIGSKGNDENGHDTGAAYLYKYIDGDWVERAKLISSDASISQSFGTIVTIDTKHIAVGTAQYYGNRNISVYVYNLLHMRSVKKVNETKKISKSGFYRHDRTAVDISKDYMVIGVSGSVRRRSLYHNYYGYRYYQYHERDYVSVTIYKYINNTWSSKFELPLRAKNLSTIAIDRSYMAMITSNGSANSITLSVFTYDHEEWSNETILPLPSNMNNYSLEIHNGSLVIGASNIDGTSVYVYTAMTKKWKMSDAIIKFSGCHNHSSVAMYGSRIVIGCPFYDAQSGIAYVFNRTAQRWSEEIKLLPFDRKQETFFANDVAIYDDVIAVGRYGDDSKGYFSGAVHIFRRRDRDGTMQWVEEEKVMASDASAHDYFGWAISLSGSNLVVGSRGDDQNGLDSGATYLYSYVEGAWVERAKLISSDGPSSPYFGNLVAIDGNHIIVGTGRSNKFDSDISVYIYSIDEVFSNITSKKERPVDNSTTKVVERNLTSIDKDTVLLQCNEHNMTAYWVRSHFNDRNLTVMTLSNGCQDTFTSNATMFWMTISYHACGTIIMQNDNAIVLRNTAILRSYQSTNNIITRGMQVYQFNLECVFPRDLSTSTEGGYNISSTRYTKTFNESSPGFFHVTMDIYKTSYYIEKVNYPMEISLNEPLFVGVRLTKKLPDVKLVVQKCYATASPAIDDLEAYVFYLDKCALDKTFKIVRSSDDRFHYVIDAFQFIRIKRVVFLHCVVVVCKRNSSSPKCSQECVTSSPFHARARREVEVAVGTKIDKGSDSVSKHLHSYTDSLSDSIDTISDNINKYSGNIEKDSDNIKKHSVNKNEIQDNEEISEDINRNIKKYSENYIKNSDNTVQNSDNTIQNSDNTVQNSGNIQYVTSGQIVYVKRKTCRDISQYCQQHAKCIQLHPARCRCNDGYVQLIQTNICTKDRVVIYRNLRLDQKWLSTLANYSSYEFLNFASTMESKLFQLFVHALGVYDIVGAKVIAARPGSIYVDFAITYSQSTTKNEVTKKLDEALRHPKYRDAFGELSISLQTLPSHGDVSLAETVSATYTSLITAIVLVVAMFVLISVVMVAYKHYRKMNVSVLPMDVGFDLQER